MYNSTTPYTPSYYNGNYPQYRHTPYGHGYRPPPPRKMSFFGIGQQGITLKELLENPKLQTAPNLNSGQDGKLKGGNSGGVDFTSAFLGPNLWDSSSYSDQNLQLEYMDLDEFLSENGIPFNLSDDSNSSKGEDKQISKPQASPSNSDLINVAPSSPTVNSVDDFLCKDLSESESSKEITCSPLQSLLKKEITSVVKLGNTEPGPSPPSPQSVGSVSPPRVVVDFDVDDQDLALASVPGQDFDPKRRKFTTEELKPQPIIKKSRKVFVPDECKDDKYWNRRKKNNFAAKRSRDARRIKENQISMRAAFLEQENETLRVELEKLKKENVKLKHSLNKYEGNQIE